MKVKNKWNGQIYEIVLDKGKSIVLKRYDGSIFEIAKSEFSKAYYKEADE